MRRIGDLAPRMAEALSLKVRGWPAKIAAEHLKVKLPTYYNTVKAALDRVGADSFDEVLRVVAADLSAEHARQSTI